MQGQDQDPNRGYFICKTTSQDNAIETRHRNVNDRNVGLCLANDCQCRRTVGRLSDEIEVAFCHNKVAKPVEDDWMIVRKNNARAFAHVASPSCPIGIRAKIVVPALNRQFNFNLAANQGKAFRACRQDPRPPDGASPLKASASKPQPLSSIVNRKVGFCALNDDADLGRLLRVLGDVGQRLLNDAINGRANLVRQIIEPGIAAVEIGLDTVSHAPFRQVVAKRTGQPYLVDRQRPQFPCDPMQCFSNLFHLLTK